MDIFEEFLKDIGIEVEFDEDDFFSCEMIKDDDIEGRPLRLFIYRDYSCEIIRIAVITRNCIPEDVSFDLFMEFGEKALDPMRDGGGIGIYPETKNIALYQVISLRRRSDDNVVDIIGSLVDSAEEWDRKLLNTDEKSESKGSTSNDKFHFIPR